MQIKSPLKGVLIPLHLVDDEVFSKKMAGDGIAIDPASNILMSPLDGTVTFIHPSQHAVTIQSSQNPEVEVLIHIGLDTVNLKGEGFKSFVKNGAKVNAGQKLIEFDLDLISQKAKSPHTIILVTGTVENPNKFQLVFPEVQNSLIPNLEMPLFELIVSNTPTNVQASNAALITYKESILCPIPSGIHARPASMITKIALSNQDGSVELTKGSQKANAKSLTSLIALSVSHNDQIEISASGSHAEKTVKEIIQQLKDLSHDTHTVQQKPAVQIAQAPMDQNQFQGISVSWGDVSGKIWQFKTNDIIVKESKSKNSVEIETQRLRAAVAQSQKDIQLTIDSLSAKETEKKSIYQAHLELLNDPELWQAAQSHIQKGLSAEYSWQESINKTKAVLQSLKNEVMAERANDVRDVGQKVLRVLLNVNENESSKKLNLTGPHILIARNLTPSDMSLFDGDTVKGLVLVEGGASSHVAIIARSMGISAITAVHESVLNIKDGTSALLLSKQGKLKLNPTASEIDQVQKLNVEVEKENSENLTKAKEPASTTDGHRIEIFANIGKSSECAQALKNGAEGVGLLRSEFLFLDRTTAPSETEQTAQYQEIISAFNQDSKKDVIIRTLDVGGDKPLSYLQLPAEENPFLGVRGLRLSLKYPEIFRSQIRSLLKVKPLDSLKIMFPMITTLDEIAEAKKITNEEAANLNVEAPQLGIMIEVPSAALTADTLAPHVDFFSIGSNDLTQYTLAIDRGHKDLAAMADGLHPSVLKLIKMTCDAAHQHKKMVGVCGGIAGDIQALPLLIGLGVHELSVSVPSIPQVKATVRKLSFKECETLANEALKLSDAQSVRNLSDKVLAERG